MAAGTLEESVLNPEAVLPALDRVLASDSFRGATRVQQFLRHIVLRTLAGDHASLKEARLAVEVFDRGDSFDSAADSIVRTQASLLRKRLADYYSSAPPTESLRIELPRGAYVARFVPIAVLAPAPAAPPPKPAPGPWIFVAAGLLVGVAATALFFRFQLSSPNTASLPIWSTFMDPVQVTTLALGTPFFTESGNGLYLRDVTINDEKELSDRLRQPGTILQRFDQHRPSHLYTGVGEALGLERISRVFEKNNWPLRVVRADLLRWQDLKDENVIFLGSSRFRSVAGELDPYAHFAYDPTPLSGRLVNLHPRPGEAKDYVMTTDTNRGVSYALVTLLPGKTQNRRVLFLQGMNTWGTQAAAEFVASPEHLEALRRKFPVPRYIQILIRAELRNDQPLGIDVVTTRDLTPAN